MGDSKVAGHGPPLYHTGSGGAGAPTTIEELGRLIVNMGADLGGQLGVMRADVNDLREQMDVMRNDIGSLRAEVRAFACHCPANPNAKLQSDGKKQEQMQMQGQEQTEAKD